MVWYVDENLYIGKSFTLTLNYIIVKGKQTDGATET